MSKARDISNIASGTNTAVGEDALENTTASSNTAVGYQAGYNTTTAGENAFFGSQSGYAVTTGVQNSFIGEDAGSAVTTGSKNAILGSYNGNQGGLDIRTSNNNIVLSDGDGNPRLWFDGVNGGRPVFDWSGAATARFECSNASPYGLFLYFNNAAPDNTSNYFMKCQDTTAERLIIYADGDVANHDNSYGAISDAKLKEQITDASSQWDDIKALTVRKYKMKADVEAEGDSDELWRLGVVAQEVEAAGMSGLVKDTPDTDGNGNDLGTTTKQIKYSILYMKAVKALQEAMDRIETLEAKVTALEAK